jgi:hypothetical protein
MSSISQVPMEIVAASTMDTSMSATAAPPGAEDLNRDGGDAGKAQVSVDANRGHYPGLNTTARFSPCGP